MTVENAMDEFVKIWELVFTDDSYKPGQRSSKLREALQDLFERHKESPSRRLLSTGSNDCKGCVHGNSFIHINK